MYNGYYHCRLCNAIYKSCGTGSEKIMMNCMLQVTNSILKPNDPEPQCPDMISIHFWLLSILFYTLPYKWLSS